MKDRLEAISKAIIKIEKVVIAYQKEASNCYRECEVDRKYGQKAIFMLLRLNIQYDEILKENWNKGIFL